MATANLHPYHPIIYVRGFAATQGEIEDTVGDPYMGFNIGSTKARTVWTGELKRFFFESPLVRLMGEHQYEDVFVEGEDMLESTKPDYPFSYRSIIIYRYYDDASQDFGTGTTPPITHFAQGLGQLILRIRGKVLANPANGVQPENFRVHLVAHSMGGLVCRAFLQNPALDIGNASQYVDKLFTYATPHNGIDMRIVRNVPGWLSFGDVNNFNRDKMAGYLAVPVGDDVSVTSRFPADRIFNLVGTNPKDYTVGAGVSAWAAGDASDGLVRIQNATTHGVARDGRTVDSPRAFVYRSHSGAYGIVNSEEGYQNLTRFLFGAIRIDGSLHFDAITLPAEVQKDVDAGKEVHASYQTEVAVSVRGCQWQLTRREVRENSAIFRTYDELFPKIAGVRTPDRTRSPHLFSVFLDPSKSVKQSKSVSFAVDLKILVPDYEVEGRLFTSRHYEGSYLYRELILIEAIPDDQALGGWRIKYGRQDMNPGKPGVSASTRALPTGDVGLAFDIEISQKTRPGVQATMTIEARPWA